MSLRNAVRQTNIFSKNIKSVILPVKWITRYKKHTHTHTHHIGSRKEKGYDGRRPSSRRCSPHPSTDTTSTANRVRLETGRLGGGRGGGGCEATVLGGGDADQCPRPTGSLQSTATGCLAVDSSSPFFWRVNSARARTSAVPSAPACPSRSPLVKYFSSNSRSAASTAGAFSAPVVPFCAMGVSVYREVTMTSTTTAAAATVASSSSSVTAAAGSANKTPSSNVLMCRQWWKVCWMYGDQEKYYRQLYGATKKQSSSASAFGINDGGGGGGRATVMELQQMSTVSFVPPPPRPDDRLVAVVYII